MSDYIDTLIAVPALTTGRRLFALKQCLEEAQLTSAPEVLINEIKSAIEFDSRTISMEWAWIRAKKSSDARGNAFAIDRKIDKIYSAIHRKNSDNIDLLTPSHPAVAASTHINVQVFPNGVSAVASLPFEDQLAMNNAIIARFEGDLSEDVTQANISEFVTELKTQNVAFSKELNQPGAKEIDYKALLAARKAGNLNVRTVVALILTTYLNDVSRQGALLTPILDQVDRIQKLRKGRRNPTDIDPETGEDISDSVDEDSDEPAAADVS